MHRHFINYEASHKDSEIITTFKMDNDTYLEIIHTNIKTGVDVHILVIIYLHINLNTIGNMS